MEKFIPSSSEDPMMRLFDHYFTPTNFIYEEFDKMYFKHKNKGHLSEKSGYKLRCFLQVWLATLFVVAEGFGDSEIKKYYEMYSSENIKMRVHWDSIHHKITQLGSELRLYRNATFHFQNNNEKFFNKNFGFINHTGRHHPIEWARELHQEIKMFFSTYRMEAAVKNLLKKQL